MKWLADECFHNDIIRGLRRRSPDIDIIRAQDVSEVAGRDDEILLAWATENDRVVVTHDVTTMVSALLVHQQRASRCTPVRVPDSLPIAQVIDDLLVLDRCSQDADWAAGLIYLPLR